MTQQKDLQKIVSVSGRGVPILGNNIDTDAIIPAVYMLELDFENGLGQYAFFNERFKFDPKTGKFVEVPAHPLNDQRYKGANILFVNRNFGCGSSREHAPQALYSYGFRAIVGESFAAIFENNCKEGGMPAVTASADHIKEMTDGLQENPQAQFSLDLTGRTLTAEYAPGSTAKVYPVSLKDTHRVSFVEGMWNSLELLLPNAPKVDAKLLELAAKRGF